MYKCIVVEDEFPAREELKFFINKAEEIEIVKEFDNPIDSLKFLEKNEVDIIFLDVNMPELDGVTLGKIIRRMNKDVKIVFITAYKEYAVDAFEIKAFDYLLKPYSEDRIMGVLENLKDSLKGQEIAEESQVVHKITVHYNDKMRVISLADILYIEAMEKELMIHTEDNIYISKLKMNEIEKILPKNIFFRNHRSYFVNVDKVIEVEPWFNGTYVLKVKGKDEKISVSRNRVKELKNLFFMK